MYKNLKQEKGIALIVLVIIIIVLIILAAVVIATLMGKNGKNGESVESGKNDKSVTVKDGEKESVVSTTKLWVQDGTTITNTQTNQKLEVGTVVSNYTVSKTTENSTSIASSYTGGWAILGVDDNGCLLLMSRTNVKIPSKYQYSGDEELYLYGSNGKDDDNNYPAGYNNAVEVMDDICEDYLNTTYATDARTIRIEDINKITKYDPMTYLDYGTWYAYYNDDGAIMSAKGNSKEEVLGKSSSEYSSIKSSDFRTVGDNEAVTVGTEKEYMPRGYDSRVAYKNEYYYYVFSSSSIGQKAYDLLYVDNYYWLGSSFFSPFTSGAYWNIRRVHGHNVGYDSLWSSYEGPYDYYYYGVRAVVSLKSNVKITTTNGTASIGF